MATVSRSLTEPASKPEHVRKTELGQPVTLLEAIREGLWEEMERDADVFLMEIGRAHV